MPTARDPMYRGHRFPEEVISYAVWLYFRFPLSLRMVEEMLAARGICVTYEKVRRWERSSAEPSPIGSVSGLLRAVTNGIWMKSSSRLRASGTALAGRRSERLRSRRPGPAPKRRPCGAEADEEALEVGGHAAARHDHGQTPFVWPRGRRWAFASSIGHIKA
jgi:putative transposase